MKSKRKKAAGSPVNIVKKPEFEQCRYCKFNADAGAEAEIVLSKPDDDFEYFKPDPEDIKYIYTQVKIPRCIECKIAHDKVDNVRFAILFYVLVGCVLAGIYFGIYEKALSGWSYLATGIGVTGGVIGIAIGIRRNFFMLPKNIKSRNDVENEKPIQALMLKGWKIKH